MSFTLQTARTFTQTTIICTIITLYSSLKYFNFHYAKRKGESILPNTKQSPLYKYRKERPALLFLTFFAWIAYAVCAILFGFTP